MKTKTYETPIIEITIIKEDIVTTSVYDPLGIMNGEPNDNWYA